LSALSIGNHQIGLSTGKHTISRICRPIETLRLSSKCTKSYSNWRRHADGCNTVSNWIL